MACVNDMSIFTSHLCSKEQNYNKKFACKLACLISLEVFKKIDQKDIDNKEFKKSIKYISSYYNNPNHRKGKTIENFFKNRADELIKWVPVSDEFKREDQTILRNSIKFRWIPVRKLIKKMIVAKAHELVKEYSNESLSTEQLDTLIKYIQAQVDKHLKLEKLGAITCIQKGKSGRFTKRANLYRREV